MRWQLIALFCVIWVELAASNERTVLEEFFISAGGIEWERRQGWLSNSSVCEWEGVTCAHGDHVTSLELQNNRLVGVLPIPSLWETLQDMQVLNLTGNSLGGSIGNELLKANKDFATLDLSRNNFTGAVEFDASRLCPGSRHTPVVLKLSDNQFESVMQKSFPPCIAELDASRNMLTALPILNGLKSTSVLEILLLGENNLVTDAGNAEWLSSLCVLPSFKELQLHDNTQLKGIIPLCVSSMTNLESIVIHNTLMGGSLPNLSRLHNLQKLVAAESLFSGTIPDSFGDMVGLQEVRLQGPFHGELPRSLFAAGSLQILDLRDNKLNGTIPPLPADTAVQHFILANNSLVGTVPSVVWSATRHRILLHDNLLTGTVPGVELARRVADVNLTSVTFYNNLLSGFLAEFYHGYASITWMADLTIQKKFFAGLDLLYPTQGWAVAALGASPGRNITINNMSPQLWPRGVPGSMVRLAGNLADLPDAVLEVVVSNVGYNVTASNATVYTAAIDTPVEIGKVSVAVRYSDTAAGIDHAISTGEAATVYEPYPKLTAVEPTHVRSQGCIAVTVRGALFSPTNSSLVCRVVSTASEHQHTLRATYISDSEVTCHVPLRNYTFELDVPYNLSVSADNGSTWSAAQGANITFYEGCSLSNAKPGETCDDGCGLCECYGSSSGQCQHSPGMRSSCLCETPFTGNDCGSCAEGYFGLECNQCPDCHFGSCNDGGGPQCSNLPCSVGDGTCECSSAWRGDTCEQMAPFLVGCLVAAGVCCVLALACTLKRWKVKQRRNGYSSPRKVVQKN